MVTLAAFVGAGLMTYLLAFPVYRGLVRAGVVDRPNARSSHTEPTVRGGGIAIMITVVASLVLLAALSGRIEVWALALGAVILAVVSWIDDIRSLPSGLRFVAHGAAALLFLAALGFPAMLVDFGGEWALTLPVAVSAVVGFFWLAGYTNAFNFMDGINGISGVQAGVTGIGMAVVAGLAGGDWGHPAVLGALIVAGAGIGFLPHNFPRARMFMGDVSSAPLGFLLAGLVWWAASDLGWWLLAPLALLHANYVFDTGITLVRRVLRRESWHSAHREHFYQRMVRSGKSHAFTTGWEAALQIATAALMLIYLVAGLPGRLLLVGVVVGIWLAFFVWCERLFRAANGGRSWVETRGMSKG